MNFELSDEQSMLQDSVRRFVDKSYSFERLRQRSGAQQGLCRSTWTELAASGWFGIGVPEALGGYGGGFVEVSLIAQELGRGLVTEPFVLCGILPSALIRNVAKPDQAVALLEPVISGQSIVAVACSEADTRGELSRARTTAEPLGGDRYLLRGQKVLVVGAAHADQFIVSARIVSPGAATRADEHTGLSLFAVDRADAGVQCDSYRLLNGCDAADLRLDGATTGRLIGLEAMAAEGIRAAEDEANLALCAYMVGAMEDSIAITAEHLKTRHQFGVSIGSFQALQHRIADMAIELNQARSMLHYGLLSLTRPAAERSGAEISGCKALIMRSAHFVTSQGIQLHGACGITEEYRIGHHFRNLLVMDALLGSRNAHLARYARAVQLDCT